MNGAGVEHLHDTEAKLDRIGEQDGDETDGDGEHDNATRIAQLEGELERVTDERNGLEAQYRNLLSKLTSMRNTLGDKLRQDAVRSR